MPPRHSWPASELKFLFGASGDDFDEERWVGWVQTHRVEAAEALTQLVAIGCDRSTLNTIVMRLHSSIRWRTMSREDAERISSRLDEARRGLEMVRNSDLRPALGDMRVEELERSLTHIAGRLDMAVMAQLATKRESHMRNLYLAKLFRYLKWATGTFQDDSVAALTDSLFGDHRYRPGSPEVWRRDHSKLMRQEFYGWEDEWERMVEAGELKPPQKVVKKPRRADVKGTRMTARSPHQVEKN